jgi:excisionase family DNA binding protein
MSAADSATKLRTRENEPPLMKTREVAEYLSVSVQTLRNWARDGVGPRSFRVGRDRRYRRDEVDAWLEEQGQE